MGWGSVNHLDKDEPELPQAVPNPSIVFVTSDKQGHKLCCTIGEHLGYAVVRSTYQFEPERLVALIATCRRLVVIVTCRESVDSGSAAQLRESAAIDAALKNGNRVAFIATEDHELVQRHLKRARASRPLVITPVGDNRPSPAFHENFPVGTYIVPLDDSDDGLKLIAKKLLRF